MLGSCLFLSNNLTFFQNPESILETYPEGGAWTKETMPTFHTLFTAPMVQEKPCLLGLPTAASVWPPMSYGVVPGGQTPARVDFWAVMLQHLNGPGASLDAVHPNVIPDELSPLTPLDQLSPLAPPDEPQSSLISPPASEQLCKCSTL